MMSAEEAGPAAAELAPAVRTPIGSDSQLVHSWPTFIVGGWPIVAHHTGTHCSEYMAALCTMPRSNHYIGQCSILAGQLSSHL